MRVLLAFLLIVGAGLSAPAKGAQVVLTSDPPGSTIYIGSANMGTTPLVLDLAAGLPIRITSRFGVLAPVEQTVTAEDNKIVACPFRHLHGTLIVSTDRADAVMTIDGVDSGRPPALLLLSPGQHKLLLRAANAPDKTRTVEVQVGYRTIIKINFSGGSPETEMEPHFFQLSPVGSRRDACRRFYVRTNTEPRANNFPRSATGQCITLFHQRIALVLADADPLCPDYNDGCHYRLRR